VHHDRRSVLANIAWDDLNLPAPKSEDLWELRERMRKKDSDRWSFDNEGRLKYGDYEIEYADGWALLGGDGKTIAYNENQIRFAIIIHDDTSLPLLRAEQLDKLKETWRKKQDWERKGKILRCGKYFIGWQNTYTLVGPDDTAVLRMGDLDSFMTSGIWGEHNLPVPDRHKVYAIKEAAQKRSFPGSWEAKDGYLYCGDYRLNHFASMYREVHLDRRVPEGWQMRQRWETPEEMLRTWDDKCEGMLKPTETQVEWLMRQLEKTNINWERALGRTLRYAEYILYRPEEGSSDIFLAYQKERDDEQFKWQHVCSFPCMDDLQRQWAEQCDGMREPTGFQLRHLMGVSEWDQVTTHTRALHRKDFHITHNNSVEGRRWNLWEGEKLLNAFYDSGFLSEFLRKEQQVPPPEKKDYDWLEEPHRWKREGNALRYKNLLLKYMNPEFKSIQLLRQDTNPDNEKYWDGVRLFQDRNVLWNGWDIKQLLAPRPSEGDLDWLEMSRAKPESRKREWEKKDDELRFEGYSIEYLDHRWVLFGDTGEELDRVDDADVFVESGIWADHNLPWPSLNQLHNLRLEWESKPEWEFFRGILKYAGSLDLGGWSVSHDQKVGWQLSNPHGHIFIESPSLTEFMEPKRWFIQNWHIPQPEADQLRDLRDRHKKGEGNLPEWERGKDGKLHIEVFEDEPFTVEYHIPSKRHRVCGPSGGVEFAAGTIRLFLDDWERLYILPRPTMEDLLWVKEEAEKLQQPKAGWKVSASGESLIHGLFCLGTRAKEGFKLFGSGAPFARFEDEEDLYVSWPLDEVNPPPRELLSQLDILGRLDDLGGFWHFMNHYC